MNKLKSAMLAVLLVSVVSVGAISVAEIPKCNAWMDVYQKSMKRHAKHFTHAAKLHFKGVPVVQKTHNLYAHYSSKEMVRKFRMLCGDDLPIEPVMTEFLPDNTELVSELEMPVLPLLSNTFTPVSDITVASNSGNYPTYSGSYPTHSGIGVTTPSFPTVLPPTTSTPIPPVPENTSLLLVGTGILCIIIKQKGF